MTSGTMTKPSRSVTPASILEESITATKHITSIRPTSTTTATTTTTTTSKPACNFKTKKNTNKSSSFVRVRSDSNSNSSPSWRSRGWAPLSYPSSALYQYNPHHKLKTKVSSSSSSSTSASCSINASAISSNDNDNDNDNDNELNSNQNGHNSRSKGMNNGSHWELNPFFPLHKDILLAATRELLILDGSLNPKTLEVIPPQVKEEKEEEKEVKLEGVVDPQNHDNMENSTVSKNIKTTTTASHTTDKSVMSTVNATTNTNTGKKNHIIVVGKCVGGAHKKNKNNVVHSTKNKNAKTKTKNNDGKFAASCVTPLTSNRPKSRVKRKRSDSTASETNLVIPFVEHLRQHKKTKLKKQHESETTDNKNRSVNGSNADTSAVVNHHTLDDNDNDSNNDNNKDEAQHTHSSNDDMSLPVSSEFLSSPLNETVLQAEDLANIILQQCVWGLDRCDEDQDDNIPSFIRLSSSTNPTSENEQQQELYNNFTHVSRPRKVSDVDDLTFVSTASCRLSSDISPHLAVVATNHKDEQHQDTLHSVKRLLSVGGDDNHGYYHNKCKNILDVSNQEEVLLELQNNLPRLLDVSIMVESHLRRTAYQMIQRLTSHFDEKTNREFLGYKSSSLKKDRILLLMSDFLFDVSHAMFAWDQTEAETFGTDAYPNAKKGNHTTLSSALDDKSLMLRDKKVCGVLFDSKTLRKIGGFDSSSLLYHAVSIQRLRAKKEMWVDLAKTTTGKKMLRHHFDNQARVQVGQIRRGQRIRKSRSVFHPITTTATLNEKSLKSQSRSSSIAIDQNEPKNILDCHSLNDIVEDDSNSMLIQSIIPDSLSITVSRQDTSKSWGILLAKEGSMCMVMRVPNEKNEESEEVCPNSTLQRGDLIVSFRNERNETLIPSQHNIGVSSDWFGEAVSLFKRSCTLHLNVRRVTCSSKSH